MIKDLSEFVAPQEGVITLCEVDGRVHTSVYKANNTNNITKAVSYNA